jgi:hypothetical protein
VVTNVSAEKVYPEDGGETLLRKRGKHLQHHKASQPEDRNPHFHCREHLKSRADDVNLLVEIMNWPIID